MSKGKIYTLLVFCLSFAVVFGGWFLTKEMLNRKEAEILAEKGQISIEVSENVAENEGQENQVAQEEFEGKVLSEDVIAQILAIWEAGGRELPHEPKTGQMNMEQAIKAGREWIDTLAEKNYLPTYLSECSFDNTSAALCTLESKVSIDEALMSYWRIVYAEGDVEIILTLHAVSGQVWKADISMNTDKLPQSDYTDDELLSMAFPFVTGDNEVVYATLKREDFVVNKQEPITRLILTLNTDIKIKLKN